jgi:hypothetical protein
MVLRDDDACEIEEDDRAVYEIAINHRNRLIDHDKT